MQNKLAELESKLTQQVVQADPKASAPKANESQSDWLQRLLDEGEEVNPKLVDQIRSLESKLEQMNQSVQMHNQRWQNVEWAQANVAYDQAMAKLQSESAASSGSTNLGALLKAKLDNKNVQQ